MADDSISYTPYYKVYAASISMRKRSSFHIPAKFIIFTKYKNYKQHNFYYDDHYHIYHL